MGRPEKRIKSDAGPLERFAQDLRRLRKTIPGLTYRAMAVKANYSPTVLSEAASGRKLPTLDVTLAYVAACEGDLDEWSVRWHAVARELDARNGQANASSGENAPTQQRKHRSVVRVIAIAVPSVLLVSTAVVAFTMASGRAPNERTSAPQEQSRQRGTPVAGAPPPGVACSELLVAHACFDQTRADFWVKDQPPGDADHAAVYWATVDSTARGECHNLHSSDGPWVTCAIPDSVGVARTPLSFRVAVVDRTTVRQWGPNVASPPR